jgi:hypothetical protein
VKCVAARLPRTCWKEQEWSDLGGKDLSINSGVKGAIRSTPRGSRGSTDPAARVRNPPSPLEFAEKSAGSSARAAVVALARRGGRCSAARTLTIQRGQRTNGARLLLRGPQEP